MKSRTSRWGVFREITLVGLLFFFQSRGANAQGSMQRPTLSSLIFEALSDPLPFVFPPGDVQANRDLDLNWVGAPAGASAQWVSGSHQWIRVNEVIVLPRARLRLEAPLSAWQSAKISYAGSIHEFAQEQGRWVAEFPVIAVSGNTEPITVVSNEQSSQVQLQWIGSQKLQQALFTDPSCSSYQLAVDPSTSSSESGWGYLGCRWNSTESDQESKLAVDVLAVTDSAQGAQLQAFRVRSQPGYFRLSAQSGSDLKVRYRISDRFTRGFFNAGLGPYAYQFDAPGVAVKTVAPVLTLYSSVTLTRDYRLVLFNATSINRYFFSDIGAYLHTEYARILDRRMSISLMLGAHTIAYRFKGETHSDFWAPQGFEVTFRDALMKNRNFAFGAFIYPNIDEESYYNLWVRWGSPTVFAEINYIDWVLKPRGGTVHSQAFGLCVGFPLTRFW